MLDYDDYSTHPFITDVHDDSSPEALFFGSSRPNVPGPSRFTSTEASPEGYSPFATGLAGLKSNSSSEFNADGDSPGLGMEMKGLKINSRFPSPMQGTVRLEDVMLPTESGTSTISSEPTSGPLFDNQHDVDHVESGLFQS